MEQNLAKRLKFEEIVGREFRWPKAGDDPFAIDSEVTTSAQLAEDDFSRFVLMSVGYRRSADVLVERALEVAAERDILIYPILFLYRQSLELNLKYLINVYGGRVEVGPIWDRHDFSTLWNSFLMVLERYGTDDPDTADDIVGGVIAQFENIDPGSFSNRYPCDTKGNPIPLVQDTLQLETLKDVMNGVFAYFSGCDGYFSASDA